jgi:hypothetical protein
MDAIPDTLPSLGLQMIRDSATSSTLEIDLAAVTESVIMLE